VSTCQSLIEIPAKAVLVGDTRMCSCLEKDGVKVGTIEHLMSALAGLGIDNAWVDLDAPEVPILDGSAAPFVFLIQSAGIEEQNAAKKFIRVTQPIEVRDGDKWARFEPYDGYRWRFPLFSIIRRSTSRRRRLRSISPNSPTLVKCHAPVPSASCRKSNTCAKTASLSVVVWKTPSFSMNSACLNQDGLRYGDEFVKHKILDAIGDFYLLGHPLLAAYSSHKGGHALNNQLARALLDHPESWEFATFEDAEHAPAGVARWLNQPA
jgi:UDP-3-O-[3-hydroxymyristoyl] N-acetylglucosamine deacetylase